MAAGEFVHVRQQKFEQRVGFAMAFGVYRIDQPLLTILLQIGIFGFADEGTIVEVRIPVSASQLKGKSRSVADFAFYGMWKDRSGIGAGVGYIGRLRRDVRG
jgi:hypothetical protein